MSSIFREKVFHNYILTKINFRVVQKYLLFLIDCSDSVSHYTELSTIYHANSNDTCIINLTILNKFTDISGITISIPTLCLLSFIFVTYNYYFYNPLTNITSSTLVNTGNLSCDVFYIISI